MVHRLTSRAIIMGLRVNHICEHELQIEKQLISAVSHQWSELYLVGSGSLGHKAPSMEVDEQPGGARLLLHPGQMGHGVGGRVGSRESKQLFTVL